MALHRLWKGAEGRNTYADLWLQLLKKYASRVMGAVREEKPKFS